MLCFNCYGHLFFLVHRIRCCPSVVVDGLAVQGPHCDSTTPAVCDGGFFVTAAVRPRQPSTATLRAPHAQCLRRLMDIYQSRMRRYGKDSPSAVASYKSYCMAAVPLREGHFECGEVAEDAVGILCPHRYDDLHYGPPHDRKRGARRRILFISVGKSYDPGDPLCNCPPSAGFVH